MQWSALSKILICRHRCRELQDFQNWEIIAFPGSETSRVSKPVLLSSFL